MPEDDHWRADQEAESRRRPREPALTIEQAASIARSAGGDDDSMRSMSAGSQASFMGCTPEAGVQAPAAPPAAPVQKRTGFTRQQLADVQRARLAKARALAKATAKT
eukprot:5620821-Alexandrium_andersonii.AAC.1